MKVAVVGGGSTYTPELVSELSHLDVSELVLQDIDAERREVVGGLARRMLDRQGYRGRLTVTEDLDRALYGAHAVLIQIRDGWFMALDAKSGKVLWKFQTGGSISAAPISYLFRGKQYIAIAAGGALFTFGL